MEQMQSGSTTTEYVYDVENRLTQVKNNGTPIANYQYDDFGERTSKDVGGTQTDYFYPLYEEKGSQETQYVMLDGIRIATVQYGSAVTYIHPDHLGSHHVLTNATGTELQAVHYKPFGEFDGAPLTEGPAYTGQHYDNETGLYYYGARYYNPKIGRFITPDWVVPNPFNSQHYNRYSYVGNNPINYVDPTGNMLILTDNQLDQVGFSNSLAPEVQSWINHTYNQTSDLRPRDNLIDIELTNSLPQPESYPDGSFKSLHGNIYNQLGIGATIAGAGAFLTDTASDQIFTKLSPSFGYRHGTDLSRINSQFNTFSKVGTLTKWVGRGSGVVTIGSDLLNPNLSKPRLVTRTTFAGMAMASNPYVAGAGIVFGIADLLMGDDIDEGMNDLKNYTVDTMYYYNKKNPTKLFRDLMR